MIKLKSILSEIKLIPANKSPYNKFKVGDEVIRGGTGETGKIIRITFLKMTPKGYRKVGRNKAEEIMIGVNNQPQYPKLENYVIRYFFNPKNQMEKDWNKIFDKTIVVNG